MRRIIIIGLALGISAAASFANEPYLPKREKAFSKADANRDGKLSPQEFALVAGKGMMRLDQNADGTITATEIDAVLLQRLQKRRARIMQSLDANADGSVTREELDKFVESLFNGADADKDGLVSLAEAQAFKAGPWRKTYLGQRSN
jgi:Ca2+-binding EF-hand superfamily protein